MWPFKKDSTSHVFKLGRKIENTLKMFDKAHRKISKINDLLVKVHDEEHEVIVRAEANKQRIIAHLEHNNKVMDELKKFLPSK